MKPREAGTKSEEGFSLVEVLLACTLLMVTLLSAALMALTAYSTLDRSGEATTVLALSQQRIEWLRNQAYTSGALAAGTTTETLVGTYAGYIRTTTIEDNVPRSGVKQVTVTVRTISGATTRVVALIAKKT
jgi:Tfp pilus assembly protein PilV